MAATTVAPKRTGSFYSILGVKKEATDAEIRTAYRKAALTAHPDKGGSEQRFRELSEAYQTINTADKRRKYNDTRRALQRVQSFTKIRPKPLIHVKKPLKYRLLDGQPYEFETAPDQLRCRFRHGDVVQGPTDEQGVIIGLASDGIYWVKNDVGYASLLFSPDMGGDKDIHVLFRDKTQPKATAVRKHRDEHLHQEAMKTVNRRREMAMKKLNEMEQTQREEIESAVELYFAKTKRSLNEELQRCRTEVPKFRPAMSWRRETSPAVSSRVNMAPAPTVGSGSAAPVGGSSEKPNPAAYLRSVKPMAPRSHADPTQLSNLCPPPKAPLSPTVNINGEGSTPNDLKKKSSSFSGRHLSKSPAPSTPRQTVDNKADPPCRLQRNDSMPRNFAQTYTSQIHLRCETDRLARTSSTISAATVGAGRCTTPRGGRNSEARAEVRSRSSSATPVQRSLNLANRRGDLDRMLSEAKALRRQVPPLAAHR